IVLRAMRRQSAMGVAHRHHPPLHGRGLVLWVWPRALSGTVTILQNYFEVIRAPGDPLDVFMIIDILKYIIYGLAAGFFVFGVLLLVEGFFTTGAIRDLYGEFKITACGRCLTAFLMFLAYLFFLVWLGVTAFTSLPVFMYFNVWSMCQNTSSVEGANLCLDLRQFGTMPTGKKVCTGSEKFFKMCESNELDLTFHLFVCALAGAGAAVIAMVHFLMALAANWGYLKDASRMQKYEDIKSKEEQELHDILHTLQRTPQRLHINTQPADTTHTHTRTHTHTHIHTHAVTAQTSKHTHKDTSSSRLDDKS
uniref:Neuronal membrane glycoprotein M6-a n=1 Tax=Salarias fasciatus TaxID=181472 RepID=A0A672FFB7_SALFA